MPNSWFIILAFSGAGIIVLLLGLRCRERLAHYWQHRSGERRVRRRLARARRRLGR